MTPHGDTAMTARTAMVAALLAALPLAGCGGDEPDAYGNFEATEVVVSAEAAGRLLRFDAEEGRELAAGTEVGRIDTAPLELRRDELRAQRGAATTRTGEAEAQIGVLQAQLATAREELARTQRLYRAEAATAQQLNTREGEVRVLQEQIDAARARTGTAREETGGVDARIAQVEDEISRTRVVNPSAGTVLATFAEAGEFVQRGQPLYKVADLRTLTLRAYVSGAQLAAVRLGQRVQVRIDAGGDALRTLDGTVTWVASEAEFTPTPIQTREERTDQVYAVKVRVANPDGAVKVGMPGELVLPSSAQPTADAASKETRP